jgi:hypothetical protein
MILKHPGCYSGRIGYDCEKGGCGGGRGHHGRGVETEAWQAPVAKVAPDAAKSPTTEREGRWRRPRPCEGVQWWRSARPSLEGRRQPWNQVELVAMGPGGRPGGARMGGGW